MCSCEGGAPYILKPSVLAVHTKYFELSVKRLIEKVKTIKFEMFVELREGFKTPSHGKCP